MNDVSGRFLMMFSMPAFNLVTQLRDIGAG